MVRFLQYRAIAVIPGLRWGRKEGRMTCGPNSIPCDRHRLLITEDNDAVREALSRVVGHWLRGCTVDLAINGLEALQSFRELHQGVVLMDLKMPVMDGETAYSEIRRMCHTSNWEMPSVVFCTAYMPSEAIRGIVASDPGNCILQKPVRPDVLVDTVKQHLAL